jgi:hypothetical protein
MPLLCCVASSSRSPFRGHLSSAPGRRASPVPWLAPSLAPAPTLCFDHGACPSDLSSARIAADPKDAASAMRRAGPSARRPAPGSRQRRRQASTAELHGPRCRRAQREAAGGARAILAWPPRPFLRPGLQRGLDRLCRPSRLCTIMPGFFAVLLTAVAARPQSGLCPAVAARAGLNPAFGACRPPLPRLAAHPSWSVPRFCSCGATPKAASREDHFRPSLPVKPVRGVTHARLL